MMTDRVTLARRFVDLHAGAELLILGNPTNVGTAKLLERIGYQALGTSSAALARAMGRTDGRGEVDRDTALRHAAEIAAAVQIPVSGDFENGFGHEPAAAAATVRASIDAGLAGCCIEDATGDADRPIYERAAAEDRIAAAAAEVGSDPFVLIARAENYLHGRPDLDDTIDRLVAFEKAGASGVYAPGLRRLEDIKAVVGAVSIPVNVLVGLSDQPWTIEDLESIGVRRVSVGSGFERVANRAFEQCALALRNRSVPIDEVFA